MHKPKRAKTTTVYTPVLSSVCALFALTCPKLSFFFLQCSKHGQPTDAVCGTHNWWLGHLITFGAYGSELSICPINREMNVTHLESVM